MAKNKKPRHTKRQRGLVTEYLASKPHIAERCCVGDKYELVGIETAKALRAVLIWEEARRG